MRVVTVIINERCPLKCRHCSVGFSETNRGSGYRISPDTLVHLINGIDTNIYDLVLFAGGEPSLDPALIRLGIGTCKTAGLSAAMVTAPVWASTQASTKRLLDKVDGLSRLILSYDDYHLEFLKYCHYENAAREAAVRGMLVDIHITYSREDEKQRLINSVESIRSLVSIALCRTVPTGNAAKPGGVDLEFVTVNCVRDLDAIPRGCLLGYSLVDAKSGVHGCCWSSLGEDSPFSFVEDGEGLEDKFRKMEASPVFQAVLKNGFLDSLSPEGREALVERVRGQRFSNECHICIAAMKKGSENIWGNCSL